MLSTNRLLPGLALLILFVTNEAWGFGYNPSSNCNSRRIKTGTSSSVAVGNSGTNSDRTQNGGQIPSSTFTDRSSQADLNNGIGSKNRGRKGGCVSRQTSTTTASTTPADTCISDKSPAQDCFDFFTLAVLWTAGYAYKLSVEPDRPCLRDAKYAKWIIHGLWPSKYGKAEISPRCKRSDIYFNIQNINRNGLKGKLDGSWFSLYAQGETSNSKFWEHELNKHGKCAVRSKAIKTAVNYFEKTYQLFENLSIGDILFNARYRPGGTDKLRTIINIIENKVGKKVRVNFVKNRNNDDYYLTEVHVCYDIQLSAKIDCPKSHSEVDLDKRIKYLKSC